MTRTVPSGIATKLATGQPTLRDCLRLDLSDGTHLCLTSHDVDVVVNLGDGAGPLTYRADIGMTPSALKQTNDLSPGNGEARGPICSDITRAAVLGGRYRGAIAWFFEVDYVTPANFVPWLKGRVAHGRVEAGEFVFALRDWRDNYNQTIGRVLSPGCTWDFGVYHTDDARRGGCPVVVDPSAWQALTGVTGRRGPFDALHGSVVAPSVFNGFCYEAVDTGTTGASEPAWPTSGEGATVVDGSTTWTARVARTWPATVIASPAPDDLEFAVSYPVLGVPYGFFPKGEVYFTSGVLANLPPVEVFAYDAPSFTFTMLQPWPEAPAVGDALKVRLGCDRLIGTCRDTYRASRNFGGQIKSPGDDQYLRWPVPGNVGG